MKKIVHIFAVLFLLSHVAYAQMPTRKDLRDPRNYKTVKAVSSHLKKKQYKKAAHATLANPMAKKYAGKQHAGLEKAVDMNARKQYSTWKKEARKDPEAFARKKYTAARKRNLLALLE